MLSLGAVNSGLALCSRGTLGKGMLRTYPSLRLRVPTGCIASIDMEMVDRGGIVMFAWQVLGSLSKILINGYSTNNTKRN